MSFNIVKASEAHITSDVVDRIANATGESPGKTREAMSTGILGVIASVTQRGEAAAGAEDILSTLKLPLFGGAEKLAASFLGDRSAHLTDVIAKQHGIGRPAAQGVMSAVLPLVASALGKEVSSRGLHAGGLVDLLRTQREKLMTLPGLGPLAGMFGLRTDEPPKAAVVQAKKVEHVTAPPVEHAKTIVPPVTTQREAVKEAAPVSERKAPVRATAATPPVIPVRAGTPERPTHVRPVAEPRAPVAKQTAPVKRPAPEHVEPARKRSWLPIALGLGALGLGALLFGRRFDRTEPAAPVAEAPRAEPAPAQPMPPPPAAVPEPAGQTTITAAEVTTETSDDPLKTQFDGENVPDKLTLSDVTFAFGTAKLASGDETVERVATLMKEKPKTRVRLEGHTDSVGDATENVDLSLKRAMAVRKALIDKGVDGRRLIAVGIGERAPVAPNDTAEGRAKNRRIDAIIIER